MKYNNNKTDLGLETHLHLEPLLLLVVTTPLCRRLAVIQYYNLGLNKNISKRKAKKKEHTKKHK